jgi:hypothetical protein
MKTGGLAASADGVGVRSGKVFPVPRSVVGWIFFCGYCNATGWLLSALHQLNALGYAIAFASFLIGAVFFFWTGRRGRRRSLGRRFGRLLPLLLAIVAGLALLGGAIHSPSNYDALAYRTPRVLHWLAAGQWHWIPTEFQRLNTRTCGIEWVTAPLIVFTRTDHLFFLINAVCFLLLPGRVFGVLTRLGVRPRVAWHWMWLLPTGYCFLLQAGSISNDLFGALFALASVEFALRARQSGRVGELWVSILAAGLMTAGKAFNLLLLLPWAVAVWPALLLLFRKPVLSAVMILFAAGASFLPTALLNQHYCQDWTGMKAEQITNLGRREPLLRVGVNAALILLENFAPTINPFANQWNQMTDRIIPRGLSARLHQNFEPAGAGFKLGEMQIEEGAGLGFGVSVLLLATVVWTLVRVPREQWWARLRRLRLYQWFVPLGAWAGAGIFMAQSGLSCPARYLAPFYVPMVAPLLVAASLTRKSSGDRADLEAHAPAWFNLGSVGVFVLAGLLVIVTPARPLWPAVTLLRAMGAERASNRWVRRAWTVYSVYGQRADAFAPARAILPEDANPLGLISADDPETSLWRPFGSRRIVHVRRDDTPDKLRQEGIKYVLVKSSFLTQYFQLSLEQWLAQNNGQLLRRLPLELRAGAGPSEWLLIQLR